MKSYEKWLKGKPELDILYLMGIFDRPADEEALKVLRKKPVIPGLTDNICKLDNIKWRYAVKHLCDLRLLDQEDVNYPGTLDCHPLVREHFGAVLKANKPSAWKEAHRRLYFHFRTIAKELPDTLAELEPLYRAVAHGCKAERYHEVMDEVYWKRINRGQDAYAAHQLGAYGANLAALSGFFETFWIQPVIAVTDKYYTTVIRCAGFLLRGLGCLREAREPMRISLETHENMSDWWNAAVSAGNLSDTSLTLGEITPAMDYARRGIVFADRSGNVIQQSTRITDLADAFHQAGEQSEAERLFKEAEELQKKYQPEYQFLYSIPGYRYCDLLLSQGEFSQVIVRAEHTLEWARERKLGLLALALDNLSLGRAILAQTLNSATVSEQLQNSAKLIIDYLNQAVQGLSESGNQDNLPLGLLARAEFYRVTHDFPAAWRDLFEAYEIAERGEMRLHLAGFHLEAARLCHAVATAAEKGEHSAAITDFLSALPKEFNAPIGQAPSTIHPFALSCARTHLATAEQMVNDMGYGRRKPEIEALTEALTTK